MTSTKISLSWMAVGLVLTLLLFMSSVALAQTETTATDIPQELVSLAQDLGCQTSSECAEKFDANIEQGIALAQKYDIYTPEQEKLANTFKTEVLARLSTASGDNFEEEILALANKILKEKPALAKTMGVTRQGVTAAETIVNTVKEAGVDIQTCQKSPEDLSREQLISCVKAGNNLQNKGTSVGAYIPKGNVKAGEVGRILDLETSLLAGEYSGLGKIGVEEAGQICLKPGSESITDCDRIATKFFGSEGVQELRQARQQTTRIKEYYTQGIERMELVTPDGQKLIGKGAIKNACNRAFEDSNLGLARACGNFAVKNGYATQEEIEDGLKIMETFSQKSEGVNFDDCRFNPESCKEFLPDEFRGEFDSQFEIFKIMSESIGFDPARCENAYDPDIGKRCLEGAKKALGKVEEIAKNSPAARRIVDEIRGHINEGERMTSRRDEFNEDSSRGGMAGPGGCRGPEDCFNYCSQPTNSAECISFGAKSQIFDQSTIVQKFNDVNKKLNTPYPGFAEPGTEFDYMPYPNQSNQQNQQNQQNQTDPGFNRYPYPQAPTGPSPECFAAISSGDFAKAKEACSSTTTNYPRPTVETYPVCPAYSMPSPCPEGQMRQAASDARGCMAYGACTVVENYRPIDTPVRSCPSGQYMDGRGVCVTSTTPTIGSCDYSTQYWKPGTSECKPRTNCSDTTNSEYNSPECQGVRGMTTPVSYGCGSFTTQSMCQASPGCGWANGACGGSMTTTNTACTTGQYWNGTACVNSSTTGQCPSGQYWFTPSGGGAGYCKTSTASSMSGCFYPNATKDEKSLGWTVWCEKDYYNCHLGDSSGDTVASSGLSLGAPSWCASDEMKTNTSSTCPSGQYWFTPSGGGAGYCMSSTSSSSCPTGYHYHSESGGFCMNEQENYSGTCYNSSGTATVTCPQQTYPTSACPSGQYWSGSSCVTSTTGGSGSCGSPSSQTQSACTAISGCSWSNNACSYGTSATTCSSGQYWNGTACVTSTTSSSDSSTACAQAGGTWNSSTSYCQMPTCPSGQYWFTPSGGGAGYCMSSSSTTCSSGQYWNGTACVTSTTSSSDSSTACAQAGGTWNSSTSYCQMPTTTSSTTCPSGWYWNGSSCVSSSTSTSGSSSCTSGQYWNGTACVTTSTTDCPSGQYWNGSSCQSSTTPPPSPTPTPTPTPSSTDPATMCTQGGGTWTGSTCQMAKSISDQKAYLSYFQKDSDPLLAQIIKAFTNLFK